MRVDLDRYVLMLLWLSIRTTFVGRPSAITFFPTRASEDISGTVLTYY